MLRLDIVKHFPCIDHGLLYQALARAIEDEGILRLVRTILDSGAGVLDEEVEPHWFPGDDLLSPLRPRGLPIGNLTSQFWSNCYLDGFDHFVKRELRCKGYLRYVDDFALFSDDKAQLWEWRQAVEERLAGLRLRIHPGAQATPVTQGIPWLGFVVYPTHIRVKARKVRDFDRRLGHRWNDYCEGRITFAEFDASVQGWINHVGYADSWGLRRELLGRPLVRDAQPVGWAEVRSPSSSVGCTGIAWQPPTHGHAPAG